MSTWNKIMECVPNFSEGRDLEKIDKIVAPFRAKTGVKLLDYSNDEDHNRLVVTVVGDPVALKQAVLEAIGVAVELIDLNKHSGQHPRMGAVDVVPFIPIRGCTMEEAIALSKEVGEEWALVMPCRSSYMRNRLPPLTGRIWRRSVKESLKGWQRKSINRSGNLILVRPKDIRQPVRSP